MGWWIAGVESDEDQEEHQEPPKTPSGAPGAGSFPSVYRAHALDFCQDCRMGAESEATSKHKGAIGPIPLFT